MAKRPPRQVEIIDGLRAAVDEMESMAASLSPPASKRTREVLVTIAADLHRVAGTMDPVKVPSKWFDPADTAQAGRLVAAALLAQPRVPLQLIQKTYGAGVYAIYYHGDHPAYAPLSGTETPIYVGKADPALTAAQTLLQQGTKLYDRLSEHRRGIRTASKFELDNSLQYPLRPEDFTCRRLVTATHAQRTAEPHLIDMFRPVWNKETDICWGLSMHGDRAARKNSRPPWHVMHPGVEWAMDPDKADARPRARIESDLAQHFVDHPPFTDRDTIIEGFLAAFAQDAMVAAAPVPDTDEPLAEDEPDDGDE